MKPESAKGSGGNDTDANGGGRGSVSGGGADAFASSGGADVVGVASGARLACALLFSLCLHLLPAGLWLFWPAPPRETPQRDTLALDTIGIISHRQSDAQKSAATPPAPPPPVRSRPRPQARTPDAVAVAPEQPPEETPPEETPTPPAPAVAPTQATDSENRKAERLWQTEQEAQLIRRFAKAVTRAVRKNLRYPMAARLAGETGRPVARFTITPEGHILPGSLALAKSCGNASLDEAALATVQKTAPFPAPPRQVTLEIELIFSRESG